MKHGSFLSLILKYLLIAVIFVSVTLPLHVSAHEVYVLSSQDIQKDIHTPYPSLLGIINQNLGQFILWGFIVFFVMLGVFFVSNSRWLEKMCDPFLAKLKRFAPVIGRVTMGLSFLAAAHYGATYGPELPITSTFGSSAPLIVGVLYVIGTLIIFGIWVRWASAIALVLFATAVYFHGVYMLTYINYLGEITLLLLAGAGGFALQKVKEESATTKKIEQFGFVILRILFGIALIYASAYAKLIHANLALETVTKYHLTAYLPFEPHFLVLGTAIIEILIGLFFILGIEVRFTSIFLLFWLTQSLLFFGEVVWPHIILIGIPIALFCHGYDKYSLEGYFFKRHGREPVL